MNQYRRIVSYLYKYGNGKKGENTGFVRIDTRAEGIRLHIRIRDLRMMDEKRLKVYFYFHKENRMQLIFVDEFLCVRGNCEYKKMVLPDFTDGDFERLNGVIFLDDQVIGNERRPNEYKYMKEGLQKVINDYNLEYIDIPFFEDKDRKHPDSAVGIYVNYLEVNDLIVMPIFNRGEEDNQAFEILQRTFPNKTIETIVYNDVAKEGGLLNCTTWVIHN